MKKFAFLAIGIAIGIVICLLPYNSLKKENNGLRFDNSTLQRQLNQMLEYNTEYLPVKVKATGYAPLDPKAVEGMCYAGDPNITASGTQSDPNRVIASGPEYDFGTQIYIPNIGHRIVEDRGGAIKNGMIDIMFATQKEALEFGVQEITVFVKKEN